MMLLCSCIAQNITISPRDCSMVGSLWVALILHRKQKHEGIHWLVRHLDTMRTVDHIRVFFTSMPRSRHSVLHCLKDERYAIRWWGWWQAECLEYYVLSFIEDKMILSISFSFCRSFLAAFSLSCFLLNCLLKARSPTSSSLENRIMEVFFQNQKQVTGKEYKQVTHSQV